MKHIWLCAALGVSMSLTTVPHAQAADTPDAVMQPYKAYRAALKRGDRKAAFQSSKQAWKMAEKTLGNSKMTGDLAANYAGQSTPGVYTVKDHEEQIDAWLRAAELAVFYTSMAPEVELERRFEAIQKSMTLEQWRNGRKRLGGKGDQFAQMERALDRLGKRGSTLEGDMETLRSNFYQLKGREKKSLEAAERAEAIYTAATDGIITQYKPLAALYRANALYALERYTEAEPAYLSLLSKVEGQLKPGNELVQTAMGRWILAREAAGSKADTTVPWPYRYYADDGRVAYDPEPTWYTKNNALTRINQSAESGLIEVAFDLDARGAPINIRVTNDATDALADPLIEVMRKWRYMPVISGVESGQRTDLGYRYSVRFIDDANRDLD